MCAPDRLILAVVVLCMCFASAAPAQAAGSEWTPEKVAEATRLGEITFFREKTTRETNRGPQRWYLWAGVDSGEVTGLESAAGRLPSAEAARSGERVR